MKANDKYRDFSTQTLNLAQINLGKKESRSLTTNTTAHSGFVSTGEPAIQKKLKAMLSNLQNLRKKDNETIDALSVELEMVKHRYHNLQFAYKTLELKVKGQIDTRKQKLKGMIKERIITEMKEKNMKKQQPLINFRFSNVKNLLISDTKQKGDINEDNFVHINEVNERLITELEEKLQKSNQAIEEYERNTKKLEATLQSLKKQNKNNADLELKVKELQRSIEEEKERAVAIVNKCSKLELEKAALQKEIDELTEADRRKKQIQKRYIHYLNDFSGKLNISINNSNIDDFLKTEMDLNHMKVEQLEKDQSIVYRERVAYLLHLVSKSEKHYMQIYEKMMKQLEQSQKELKMKDKLISDLQQEIQVLEKVLKERPQNKRQARNKCVTIQPRQSRIQNFSTQNSQFFNIDQQQFASTMRYIEDL